MSIYETRQNLFETENCCLKAATLEKAKALFEDAYGSQPVALSRYVLLQPYMDPDTEKWRQVQ